MSFLHLLLLFFARCHHSLLAVIVLCLLSLFFACSHHSWLVVLILGSLSLFLAFYPCSWLIVLVLCSMLLFFAQCHSFFAQYHLFFAQCHLFFAQCCSFFAQCHFGCSFFALLSLFFACCHWALNMIRSSAPGPWFFALSRVSLLFVSGLWFFAQWCHSATLPWLSLIVHRSFCCSSSHNVIRPMSLHAHQRLAFISLLILASQWTQSNR